MNCPHGKPVCAECIIAERAAKEEPMSENPDIVKRLRQSADGKFLGPLQHRTLELEAAAEIERLRRIEDAAKAVRAEWTNKHIVNTPLDKAVVDLILALAEKGPTP